MTATVEADETVDQAINELEQRARKAKQQKMLPILVDMLFELIQTITGVTFHVYQVAFAKRIIESLLVNDGEALTALWSRQSGKTTTISAVVVGLAILLPRLSREPNLCEVFPDLKAFEKGVWIGIFAPILEQSRTLFYRIRGMIASKHTRRYLTDPDIGASIETNNGGTTELSTGSIIQCHSASPTSNIESKTYHLAIVDEAQDVTELKLRKSIEPMLTYTHGTLVLTGTPNTEKSAFFDQIQTNKRLSRLSNRKQNHFQYDYLVVQKSNPYYAASIRQAKERYGEDSDFFRMSYRLEWIFERGMFTSEGAVTERVFGEGRRKPYDINDWQKFKGWTPIAGLDLGKSQDQTVLTLGVVDWHTPQFEYGGVPYYRTAVLDWLEIAGDDWDSQFGQILSRLNDVPFMTKMCVDATGVGAGIADRLRAALPNVEVEDFQFSLQQKSDGYKHLSVCISKAAAWAPYGQLTQKSRQFKSFKQELCDLTKGWKGQEMVVAHPDERGAHDDYPDSWMLMVYAGREPTLNDAESWEDPNIYRSNQGENFFLKG